MWWLWGLSCDVYIVWGEKLAVVGIREKVKATGEKNVNGGAENVTCNGHKSMERREHLVAGLGPCG